MLTETAPTDHPRRTPSPARVASSLVAVAAVIAAMPLSSASAQNSPNSFQLPEPTPTPTPAPQGPVDVRDGVPIGPRSIPTNRPTTRPTVTPTPTPASRAPAPSAPSPTTSAPQTGQSGGVAAPSSASRSTSSDAAPTNAQQTGNIETDLSGQTPALPDASTPAAGPVATAPNIDTNTPVAAPSTGTESQTVDYWPWLAALLGLLLTGLGFWLWRNRSANRVTKLAAPSQPRPAPSIDAISDAAQEPPRIDLGLEIVVATRSFMQFSLEYRVTLANRSDRAVRDLNVSAQLVSAQRGAPNAPPIAGGQPLETIERIGPHQSRAVAGRMQIPLAEVGAILQGQKPLFIPLLHVTIEGAGQPALTRSFVVGTPSEASGGRLHPIPLDTPPGSLQGLKAREIRVEAA